jgi:hypothetical protein
LASVDACPQPQGSSAGKNMIKACVVDYHSLTELPLVLQEQVLTAANREWELQRQLLQAQLRLEQQAETAAAAVPVLALPPPPAAADAQQQADTHAVNAALARAQQQLQAQEAELQLLRQQLRAAQDRADAAAAAGVAAGGVPQQQQQQQQPPSLEASGLSGLSLDPDLLSGLPSPLAKLPPSFGSGASFWLGSGRGFAGSELPAAGAAGKDAAGRYEGTAALTAAAAAAGRVPGGIDAEDSSHGLELSSPRHGAAAAGSRMRGVVTFAGRPLSASADAAVADPGSSCSPGRHASSDAAAATVGSVAALAAHVLGGRHQQQRSHLSSLRSSLESANLLLLGSSAVQSPRRRQRQQQQHELGRDHLDSSRGTQKVEF